MYDPRFLDYGVPIAVRGTLSFKITDYKTFIKLHRLVSFDLNAFQLQIQDAVKKHVKGVVSNAPQDNSIPAVQIERKILQINAIAKNYIKPCLMNDFGETVSGLDIDEIEIDKSSESYQQLVAVTKDITTQTTQA